MGSGEEGTGVQRKRGEKCESDKKAIARELLSAAAIFHYAALRRRTQSSIFSRPRLAPAAAAPPKQLLLPFFFFTVPRHGENEAPYLSAQRMHK